MSEGIRLTSLSLNGGQAALSDAWAGTVRAATSRGRRGVTCAKPQVTGERELLQCRQLICGQRNALHRP